MKANFYNKKKIKYLEMLRSGKPTCNAYGEIIKDASFQSQDKPTARIQPSRNWFTTTKSVSQDELDKYRNITNVKNPYDVLLSTGNVPYSLINNELKLKKKYDLTECFGTKSFSRKSSLKVKSFTELKRLENTVKDDRAKSEYCKGKSKRIWNELYKVLDSSDVVVHVLDARDPLGTICHQIEKYIEKEAKHKHLMYVLNKVDLVPTSVTASWLRFLSKKHPAIAFHANSIENTYGRTNFMNLLRQHKNLLNKQEISVGFVGFPNSGKSSIINSLKHKKVCNVAPIPGETRVWQYIALMRDLYLIDCPGVVPVPDMKTAILKGAIRIENVETPDYYIPFILEKVGKECLEKCFAVKFNDIDDFLEKLGRKRGLLKKGGSVNTDLVAKHVLHDWLRGKIPFVTLPPSEE